jgi:hypothetical protein
MGSGSIGRLFWEVGAKSTLPADLQASLKAFDDLGLKASSSVKSLVSNFENALNPTKKLGEQIAALQIAGKNDADIWKIYGEQIKSATATTIVYGQTVDPCIQNMMHFGQETEKTGLSFASFGKSLIDFARNPLDTAKNGIMGLLEHLGPVAVGIGGIATAAAGAGLGIFKFVNSLSEEAEQLKITSAMTGISTQDLQAMQKVAERLGFTGLDLGRNISYLNQQLARDPKQFSEGLDKLGISIQDSSGKTKTATQILDELAIKLQAIPDKSEAAQMAAEVLGVRYRDLSAFLMMLNGTLT